MRPTAFVSAPYYNSDPLKISDNIFTASFCAQWLWNNGFYAFTPHLNTKRFEFFCTAPEDAYVSFYLKVIRSGLIDLVVMTGEWKEHSTSNCHKELKLATRLGIPGFEWQSHWNPQTLRRINA